MAQRSNIAPRVIARAPGPLETIDAKKWLRAEQIANALRPTLGRPLDRSEAASIASSFGIHVSTLYSYRTRLAQRGLTTAVLAGRVGYPEGHSRLPKNLEALTQAIVERVARMGKKVRMIDVMAEVKQRARASRLKPPSRRTVERRLERQVPQLLIRRGKEHQPVAKPIAGSYRSNRPFDVVQIDHTKIDVMVVDDLYRQPIDRPYLSIAMDVATRAVLGCLVTFEAPSAATVALIMTRIVAAKARWLAALGLAIDWPMAGLPRSVHLDNAPEFHSDALQRGCAEFGIELIYRPLGRPHFGGHIERVIGTLMNRVKALPGATGSSAAGRRRRAPEKSATLTLAQLERWLALEIGEGYHHAEHRGLKGGTPYGAWQLAAPLARPVGDLAAFTTAFLPAAERTVHRYGIEFHNIRYWHDGLARWVGRSAKVFVHYDPADISTLYVRLPDESTLVATYRDLGRPPVALAECEAAGRYLRRVSRVSVNEDRLFAAIETQRQLVRSSKHASRQARREDALRKAAEHTRKATRRRRRSNPSRLRTTASQ